MPRRRASDRPNYEDPNQKSNVSGKDPNHPRPAETPRVQQPQQARHVQSSGRVSQAKLSSLLYWLKYHDDNPSKQAATQANANPHFHPQSVLPASLPPKPVVFNSSLNPQANPFQSSQSRYNLRQRTDAQLRPYSNPYAEQVVQSIEPNNQASEPKSSALPWRSRVARRSMPVRTQARQTPDRSVTPPPEPNVCGTYLSKAQTPPRSLERPLKLLVVLDLNGAMCVRNPDNRNSMTKRPGVDALLDYVFNNHVVMICTSATERSANLMVSRLLNDEQRKKLVTIRPRHTFGLTKAQYASKVQVYKNLEDIWNDPLVENAVPQGQEPWSMTDTVLVDDSMLKAKAQPHNLIQVPAFEWTTLSGTPNEQKVARAREEVIMRSVKEKLELLKYQTNVASLIRQWQEGRKDAPGVVDEQIDQGERVALKEGIPVEAESAAENYPTPSSLEAPSAHESEAEYEPPEQIELVFRGRTNVPPTSGFTAINQVGTETRGENTSQPGLVVKGKTGEAGRSASPVTEEHFQWLKED